MAVIEELVTAVRTDISDLRGGYAQAIGETRRFGEEATRTLSTATGQMGGAFVRTFEGLSGSVAPARRMIADVAGEIRALGELADSVHLASPADVRAIQQMAADLRGVAAAAGLTAEQFRELEAVERRIGAFTPSTRSLVTPPPPVVPPPDPADIERKAVAAADLFIAGLKRELTVRQADAKEALFLGLTDRATYQRASAEAGGAFNAGIIRELQRLADRGELLPEVHQKLVRELREDGREAGLALVSGLQGGAAGAEAAVTRPLTGLRRLGGAASEAGAGVGRLNTTTAQFGSVGQRAANAAVATAFGLEALARGGTAAEGGLRTALRASASFAAMFGTQGLIASGVLATTAAVIDLFRESRDQMEATRKQFREQLAGMVNDADSLGLQRKLMALQRGEAATGPAQFSRDMRDFAGGLNDLESRAAQLNETIRQHPKDFIGLQAMTQLKALGPELEDKRKKAEELREAILNLRQVQEIRFGPTQTVTAQSDAARERDRARDANRDATRAAREARQEVERQHAAVVRVGEAAEAAALAFQGQRAAGRDTGGEFLKMVTTLREVVDLSQSVQPVLLRARLATTREELEAAIRAAIPDDVFEIRVRAEVDQIGRGLERDASAARTTGRNPFLLPEFQPGGKWDSVEKFTHTAADDFEAVARDADQVARAFALLPGLADSTAARLAGSLSAGLGGAAGIGRGANILRRDDAGITDTLSGLAGITSGALGVAGALVGLGQTLFGETAAHREHRLAVEQTTRALGDFRLSVSGFNADAAGSLQRERDAITAIVTGPYASALLDKAVKGTTGSRELVEKSIAPTGLTLDQFDAVARAKGFGSIFTSKGQVDFQVLGKFAEYLDEAVRAAQHFTGAFDDQARRLDLGDRIFGRDTPADAFNRQRELLRRFDEPVGRMFDGLDVTTAEGLARARRTLEDVFTQFSEGALAIGGLDKDQFLGILGDTDDALDRLADAADDAASNLADLNTNITGFRVAEFRFRAQAPESPFTRTTTGPGGGTLTADRPLVLDPVARPPVLGPTTTTTGAAAPPIEFHLHMDDATITTAAKSPDELLAALLRAFAAKGRNSTGLSKAALDALARALGSSAAGLA